MHRRKFEVVFVSKTRITEGPNAGDSFAEDWLRIDLHKDAAAGFPEKEIEEDIIAELVKRHSHWIENSS